MCNSSTSSFDAGWILTLEICRFHIHFSSTCAPISIIMAFFLRDNSYVSRNATIRVMPLTIDASKNIIVFPMPSLHDIPLMYQSLTNPHCLHNPLRFIQHTKSFLLSLCTPKKKLWFLASHTYALLFLNKLYLYLLGNFISIHTSVENWRPLHFWSLNLNLPLIYMFHSILPKKSLSFQQSHAKETLFGSLWSLSQPFLCEWPCHQLTKKCHFHVESFLIRLFIIVFQVVILLWLESM